MTWNYLTRNITTNSYQNKDGAETYLVSESGDFYLVGQLEDKYLITKEQGTDTTFPSRNKGNWTNLTRH